MRSRLNRLPSQSMEKNWISKENNRSHLRYLFYVRSVNIISTFKGFSVWWDQVSLLCELLNHVLVVVRLTVTIQTPAISLLES